MQCHRLCTAALVLCACSPSLDWRETRAGGSGLVAMFPCRPERYARPVTVSGIRARMEMLSCKAADTTFAVSFVDVDHVETVGPAMVELRSTTLANIDGQQVSSSVAKVSGMTPQAAAVKVSMTGRLPDGTVVQEQVAFFSKGLRIYQASMVGEALFPDATEIFFSGLKLPP